MPAKAAISETGVPDRIISIAWLRTKNHGENWHGMMSVPRELTLGEDEEGFYIRQSFVREAAPYIRTEDGRTVIEDRYIREELDAGGYQLKAEQLEGDHDGI